MSSIDSLEHTHVAKFFGLPIYWVLEEKPLSYLIDIDDDTTEVINQYYLSIGGGSGEHPALVIKNDAVVYQLIRKLVDLEDVDDGSYDHELISYAEQLQEQMITDDELYNLRYWRIDQNEWPLETFIRVNKQFDDDSEVSLLDKISHAMALFIIYEMPIEACLKDQRIIELAKMIRSNEWEKALPQEIVKYLSAVSGLLEYEKMGKVIRNGQVVWGYSLNDWRREFQKS
jgi:hypothetical protein